MTTITKKAPVTGFAALAAPMPERDALRDEELRTGFVDTLPAYPDPLPPWQRVSAGLVAGSLGNGQAGQPWRHSRAVGWVLSLGTAAALAGLAAWMGEQMSCLQHAGLMPLAVISGFTGARAQRRRELAALEAEREAWNAALSAEAPAPTPAAPLDLSLLESSGAIEGWRAASLVERLVAWLFGDDEVLP